MGGTDTGTSSEVVALQKFIVEETAAQGANSLMQNSRPVDSVFFSDMSVMDIPRSVTVIDPEALKQYGIESFADLDVAGANLTKPYTFGISAAPFIRGEFAGVYIDGMRRLYNADDTPISFGSMESMDIVKGPSPAQYGPTNAGGYVNLIPKSPYFDEFRGSVDFNYSSYNSFRTQADVGGPQLLDGYPMAYRISITDQQADSYYNAVKDNYVSIYASMKIKLNDAVRITTGSEYFNYHSNENAGWNRATQDEIDNGNYIYGNMDPNTTSAQYQGFTNENLIGSQVDIAFNTGYNPNLAIVVPASNFQARFGTPDGPNGTYITNKTAAAMTPIYYEGALYGYKYTPAYFNLGGQLFTKKISGNQVLSDPSDFANSHTLLWFGDISDTISPDTSFTAKTYFERVETQKISSYGFAEYSSSFIIEEKLIMDHNLTLLGIPIKLSYGGEADFTSVDELSDFSVEPFNRRDTTNPVIVPQSVVLVGPQDGWIAGDGDVSQLIQYALFAQSDIKFTPSLSLFTGVRAEDAHFVIGTPEQLATKSVGTVGARNYANFSGSPIYKISDMVSLYANAQVGTVFNPSNDGSVSSGSDNFNQAQLYEGGLKFNLLGGNLYFTADYYTWDKVSLADTPIGEQADNERAKGAELEFSWKTSPWLTLTGSFGAEQTFYRGELPFTTTPYTPEDVALYSGSIEYGPFGETASGGRYANNPRGLRSGYPEENANLFALVDLTHGFGVGVGPTYLSGFWNDEEHTLHVPDALVWNGNVFYRSKRLEVFVRFTNFTNERYFLGSSFADTMLITEAPPMQTSLGVTVKF
jgi:iron complex outermembrane receptor protein